MFRAAAIVVLAAGAAFAAQVELSPAELQAGSDLIVTGTVTGAVSRWNSDRTTIYTDVTIDIAQTLKGTVLSSVVVRVPGGEVGDIGMAVEDYPVLATGDAVTLRLARSEPGVYRLLNGRQGFEGTDAKPRVYYSYSGYHRSAPSCNYHINSGLPADWSNALQAADGAWDAAGSAFRLNYQGTTTLGGPAYDGYNVITRANLGGGGVLAQNSYWYNRRTKVVYENDIVFNTYYPWSTSGAAGYYDVQNIGTHEMGHDLVLDDLYQSYQSEMTMYGYGAAGETKKQTLEQGDRDGIVKIYGTGFDSNSRRAPATAD